MAIPRPIPVEPRFSRRWSILTSMASALAAKSRSLGMVIGMLITTVLISLSLGNDPIAQHPLRFIGIMVSAFQVLVALSAAALVVSVLAARLSSQS